MNMAVYHVLLNGWISALGSSEATIRMLSVLFAVMTVPALYAVGARLFSRRVGVVAAVLLALNTALYSYAREARSYSLTLLLVLVASYFLVRAAAQPQRRIFWAAYGVTAVLSVYAHFFAALVLVAHAVSLVAARRRLALPRTTVAVTAGAIAVALVPVALYIAGGETGRTTDQATALSDVPDLFYWYAGSNRPLAALYVLAALAGCIVMWRRGDLSSWAFEFVIAWFVLPIVLALVISATIDPLFVFRYLLVSLPALLLLAAVGVAAIDKWLVRTGALVLLLAVSTRVQLACHPVCLTPVQDFRAVTAHLLARAGATDGIFFDPPYLKTAFVYYATRSGEAVHRDIRCETFFCQGDQMSLDRRHDRAWLLIDEGDPNARSYQTIPDRLERDYGITGEARFPARLRLVRYANAS